MKTTLDLPDDLVKKMKLRAIHEGKKLKDAAADLLRAGLAADRNSAGKSTQQPTPHVKTDRKTGVPIIQCRRAAPRGQELTVDQTAEILLAQEAGWARDSG